MLINAKDKQNNFEEIPNTIRKGGKSRLFIGHLRNDILNKHTGALEVNKLVHCQAVWGLSNCGKSITSRSSIQIKQ